MSSAFPKAASISEFASSLPLDYQRRFTPAEVAAHAHITLSRSRGEASAGLFPCRIPGMSALCVTADDRPGLLSLISWALTECGFEVDSAEAYCRSVTPREAVDVFWLRDPAERIGPSDVGAFSEILNDVLRGNRAQIARPPATAAPSSRRNTTVRFLEQENGVLSVLEVETEDRSGLLWAISRALHEQGVQILGSQIRTEGVRVLDRFSISEVDERPISPERRFMIQVAILSILE